MSEPADTIVAALLRAVMAGDESACTEYLAKDVTLRQWRWEGSEVCRPRQRSVARLLAEKAGWTRCRLEILSQLSQGRRAIVEYRIHALEGGHAVEHNRVFCATIEHGQICAADIYCAEPVPRAYRNEWVDRENIRDEDLDFILDSCRNGYEDRRPVSSSIAIRSSLRLCTVESEEAHPAANMVMNARLSDTDADERIADIIAQHQVTGRGFSWVVSPWDRPVDLARRLEAHGMVLAGHITLLVRRTRDDLDAIATNPDVRIERVEPGDEAAIHAALDIVAESFGWPEERKVRLRTWWRERASDPAYRNRERRYMAWLDGRPVAYSQLTFKAGLAYLDGAATLPDYRGKRIYSTLLKHRLADVQAEGYGVTFIDAHPMARRVVVRYGFEEYSRLPLYGWMPEIDMDVIRSLVSGN